MRKRNLNPENRIRKNNDMPDSSHDQERLENEETTLDLPDVKDIPGQEHIHVPTLREFADTTISSADEEGRNAWKNEGVAGRDAQVTPIEQQLLEDAANDMPTKDEQALRRAALDSTDGDGEPPNEKTSFNAISGSDLDVPGADDDDANEEIGEEDEENNPYSLGGDNQSINEERSGT